MKTRAAFIEDAKGYADTLQEYIALSNCRIDSVGVYGTAEEALAALPENPADVAVVDIHLPGMSGIELVLRLRDLCPAMTCLILTTYEDSETIFNALKAGAAGYLLKRASAKEIVTAIAEVANGGSPMSPQIARRVVDFFHQPRVKNALDLLSDREHEVLQRLAAGLMYKEIADQLGINIGTVRFHINRIYGKLHVHSRAEAMLKYLGQAG